MSRPVLSLGERRSWWIGFVSEACAYAEARGRGEAVDRMDRAAFAHQVTEASRRALPLAHVSARAIASALLEAAEGLIHVECEPERRVLADLTTIAARGLDQLINADALAQAKTWQGRMGEGRDEG